MTTQTIVTIADQSAFPAGAWWPVVLAVATVVAFGHYARQVRKAWRDSSRRDTRGTS